MSLSESPTRSPDAQLKVLNKARLKAIGIHLSNPTLCRKERRGEFPKRFYLSAKMPVWDAEEVYAWIFTRKAESQVSTSTAKATASRRAGRKGQP